MPSERGKGDCFRNRQGGASDQNVNFRNWQGGASDKQVDVWVGTCFSKQ